MRYTEQRYPFRGDEQERREYEFFISELDRPTLKRFGIHTIAIYIVNILRYHPFICIQSPSVTYPRSPLFSPWADRYPPTLGVNLPKLLVEHEALLAILGGFSSAHSCHGIGDLGL